MNVLELRIIELIDQDKLQSKDEEHHLELNSHVEVTVLPDVSEDDNLIENDQTSQYNS
jgi:hypothetical protein